MNNLPVLSRSEVRSPLGARFVLLALLDGIRFRVRLFQVDASGQGVCYSARTDSWDRVRRWLDSSASSIANGGACARLRADLGDDEDVRGVVMGVQL